MSQKQIVEVVDDGGDTATLVNDNGFPLPNFPEGIGIDRVRSVKIRDDDILISTYPKSGTHWVFEIARELLAGKIIDDDVTKGQAFVEMVPEEKYADLPSPRFLNTHLLMKHLPDDVRNKKIKIIYVLRNPKDVAVSLYNFLRTIPFINYKGEWKNYLRPFFQGKFIYGSWMDYVLDWEQVKKDNPDLPVLTLFYEDIKEDQMREMRRICEFLGVERTDDFLSKVCDNTTIASMSTRKKPDDSGAKVFRKGGVGGWKNWFTVAQNEWWDRLYQERMADCPLQFKYTL
ncbi:sulfotransferase 1A2-like isoform X2 [Haliotis rubra]|uniref:sulfotransferase 1A2-like isoform X1 n=1 Tax=Haliotis rubra TaxID=36100 RepID=UPI001EE5FC3A|nr:sulfotransferase 1A2-like isoform X1 [Haliotis rubra]XP_046575814.1 sulfotransferase 1A2-like isoform X2 [Haliotis rubra]